MKKEYGQLRYLWKAGHRAVMMKQLQPNFQSLKSYLPNLGYRDGSSEGGILGYTKSDYKACSRTASKRGWYLSAIRLLRMREVGQYHQCWTFIKFP